VAAASSALAALYRPAIERHREILAEIGALDLIRLTGHLHLYRDEKQFAKDAPDWQTRERHGIRVERLSRAAIDDLEPSVSRDYGIGMFLPEHGMTVNPLRLSVTIAEELSRRQVRFVAEPVLELATEGRRVTGVSAGGRHYAADHVVVAAGMWSASLLRRIGYRIPLESQRGYHIDLQDSGIEIGRPVIPADRKVFITPMESGLRVAGTVELLGLEAPPTEKRARLLLDDLAAVFPQVRSERQDPIWMGHRPCLPDSLPVIGASRRWAGLWSSFGHGHLGLTGAAVTGAIVSGSILGDRAEIDLSRFSIDRF
jgi:D-amino-acid dehydrogenase